MIFLTEHCQNKTPLAGVGSTHRRLTPPTEQAVDEAGVYSITRSDFVVAQRHLAGHSCLRGGVAVFVLRYSA